MMARAAIQTSVGMKPEAAAILNALPHPVIMIDSDMRIEYVNDSAEQFFAASSAVLLRHSLGDFVAFGSPVLALIGQVLEHGVSVNEYGVEIGTPRAGERAVDIQVTPVVEYPGHVLLILQLRTMAHKMDRQLTHRGAARSVTGMAAILAHEIKNPLSGIRGAAQLLELTAPAEDRTLTRLICDETDRICKLVDRMEVFSDERPIQRGPVNIHEVLERCRRVAQNGFGRHVTFVERYDPSLPPVLGNRDLLVQVFLNLVKNACEAVPRDAGEITLTTSYRHGMRVAVAGTRERLHLPLQVTVQDNGPGIPEELRANLFEPFVTTKINGSGLGLAFVAKTVADHGGVIEVDSMARRTIFRLTFPIAEEPKPRKVRRRTAAEMEGAL